MDFFFSLSLIRIDYHEPGGVAWAVLGRSSPRKDEDIIKKRRKWKGKPSKRQRIDIRVIVVARSKAAELARGLGNQSPKPGTSLHVIVSHVDEFADQVAALVFGHGDQDEMGTEPNNLQWKRARLSMAG